MSRNRRDDQGPSRERTPEQRERERLEREARRAGGAGGPGASAPPPAREQPPRIDAHDLHDPLSIPPAQPPRSARAAPGRRGLRSAANEPPAVPLPPGAARAEERRAARRRQGADPDRSRVLRIQPEPPAPPAAPAGALDDDLDRPIGIRRVRRVVAPRSPRAVVTPPGDVPAGPRAPAARSASASRCSSRCCCSPP